SFGEQRTESVRLVDLDRDGNLDLFFANIYYDEECVGRNCPAIPARNGGQVWLNSGDGTFVDTGQTLPGASGEIATPGDFDGDGDLDIVTLYYQANSNNVRVARLWRNDGVANFASAGDLLAYRADIETQGFAADFDDDGDVDLLVNAVAQSQRVWLNRDYVDVSVALQNASSQALAGDTVNFEIVVQNHSDRGVNGVALQLDSYEYLTDLQILEISSEKESTTNKQPGGWTQSFGAPSATVNLQPLDTVRFVVQAVAASGDNSLSFDGARLPLGVSIIEPNDLVFIADAATTAVAAGIPVFPRGDANIPTYRDSGQTLQSFRWNSQSVGDVDNDGDVDVVLFSLRGTRLWLNNGAGRMVFQGTYGSGQVIADGALGRLDDDDQLSWAVADNYATLWYRGPDVYAPTALRDEPVSSDAVTLGDLNGDGRPDVVVVSANAPGAVFLSDSAAYVDSGQQIPAGVDVAVGDVDADGDLDLVIASRTGLAKVLLNDGAGAFTEKPDAFGFDALNTLTVDLADIDGD
ncbi:MAG: VCBS repeat-containing protein, partial [Planctomycetales bacterium]|nr:VCBS repeat-containing protein [Planctomycetales bacterium]